MHEDVFCNIGYLGVEFVYVRGIGDIFLNSRTLEKYLHTFLRFDIIVICCKVVPILLVLLCLLHFCFELVGK